MKGLTREFERGTWTEQRALYDVAVMFVTCPTCKTQPGLRCGPAKTKRPHFKWYGYRHWAHKPRVAEAVRRLNAA